MEEVNQSINRPSMLIKVKDDLLDVIARIINLLGVDGNHDFIEISRLSDRTIHNASIYQDDDSVSMAVFVYALGKIIQRCYENDCEIQDFMTLLTDARMHLASDELDEYRSAIKKLFNIIVDEDKKLKLYIEEVLHKARIKKASKMHDHGISIAKTSEILGISQWELINYVGGQNVPDVPEKMSATERYKFARSLFE